MEISIDEQIECVKREVRIRETVYPKRVGSELMSEMIAKIEIERMKAVLETLKRLQSAKLQR